MHLSPLSDWILLEELGPKEKSGIVLPDNRKDTLKGVNGFKVIAVGPGYYSESGLFITSPVAVGNIILLDSPMVAKFDYQGEKYIAAKFRDAAFTVKGA